MFGVSDMWNGLGIILDSFDNDGGVSCDCYQYCWWWGGGGFTSKHSPTNNQGKRTTEVTLWYSMAWYCICSMPVMLVVVWWIRVEDLCEHRWWCGVSLVLR